MRVRRLPAGQSRLAHLLQLAAALPWPEQEPLLFLSREHGYWLGVLALLQRAGRLTDAVDLALQLDDPPTLWKALAGAGPAPKLRQERMRRDIHGAFHAVAVASPSQTAVTKPCGSTCWLPWEHKKSPTTICRPRSRWRTVRAVRWVGAHYRRWLTASLHVPGGRATVGQWSSTC